MVNQNASRLMINVLFCVGSHLSPPPAAPAAAPEPSSDAVAVNGEPALVEAAPVSAAAPPSSDAPPKLVKDLESVVVGEKDKVVLECQISGNNTYETSFERFFYC